MMKDIGSDNTVSNNHDGTNQFRIDSTEDPAAAAAAIIVVVDDVTIESTTTKSTVAVAAAEEIDDLTTNASNTTTTTTLQQPSHKNAVLAIFETFLQTILRRSNTRSTGSNDPTTITTTIATTTTTTTTISDAVNQLEISLRQHCLQLLLVPVATSGSVTSTTTTTHEMFWYQSVSAIYWVIEQLNGGVVNIDTVEATASTIAFTPAFRIRQQLTAIVAQSVAGTTTSTTTTSPTTVSVNDYNNCCFEQLQFIRNIGSNNSNDNNYPPPPQYMTGVLSHLRKLPILLLEDITDVLSIPEAYQFWSRTLLLDKQHQQQQADERSLHLATPSTAYDIFFSDLLWYTNSSSNNNTNNNMTTTLTGTTKGNTAASTNPSWLLFLKVTNKFIRRLQQQQQTTTTTTTAPMVTAASVGAPTTTTTARVSSSTSNSQIIISELLQLLSTVYSMTEKSSTRVWGSYNEHKKAIMTSTSSSVLRSADKDQQQQQHDDDLRLCTNFWKLQDDFRRPNGIIVSDFIQRLQYLLRIFESNPIVPVVQSSLSQTSPAPLLPGKNTGGTIIETTAVEMTVIPTTAKIAPSNQTIEINNKLEQLQNDMDRYIVSNPFFLSNDNRHVMNIQIQQDGTIRNVLILQMYIVLHHLMIQVPLLRAQLQSHLRTLGSIVNTSSSSINKSNDCRTAVQATLHILNHSEMDWRQWKQNKCLPDIEQPSRKPISAVDRKAKTTASRKRKRLDDNLTMSATTQDGWNTSNIGIMNLMDVSTNMRMKYVPTIQDHCQEYVEALDPEAGIDDEYHPKNDAMFAWQALRLFAFHDRTCSDNEQDDDYDDFLSNFQCILPNGDFENMVRNIYQTKFNIPIPGTGPQPYLYVPDVEKEKDSSNDQKQEEKAIDETMIGAEDTPQNKLEASTDVEMVDETVVVQPNTNTDDVARVPVPSDAIISAVTMDAGGTKDNGKDMQTDHEQSSQLKDTKPPVTIAGIKSATIVDSNVTTIESPKVEVALIVANGQPKVQKAPVTVQNDQQKKDNITMKGSVTDTVMAERNNKSSNATGGDGDTQRNSSTITVQQRPAQNSSSSGGGGTDRNNSSRSNHPTIGPTQQNPVKSRDSSTVERSSHDTYARSSRNDEHVSGSSTSRNYHPIDHSGRPSNSKDSSSGAPTGGRSRDDMHRGNIRDDHHQQQRHGGGSSDGPRWEGQQEWRKDHRGAPSGSSGSEYHHGRSGGNNNNNNNSSDSRGRGNTTTTTGSDGTNNNNSNYRSRSGGGGSNSSSWPRDGGKDGNTRQR